MKVRLGGKIDMSYKNGKGCRTVIFLSGCIHGCKGCHNRDLWDMTFGEEVDIEDLYKLIDKNYPIIDGITISGGEPFLHKEVLYKLVKYAKGKRLSVWIYTGYTYDQLTCLEEPLINDILDNIDVLVDGKFVEELHDPELLYRGSINQKILDLKHLRECAAAKE